MDEKQRRTISKFLSLVLRHQPSLIGITLDEMGFVSVAELLTAMASHRRGSKVTREQLDEVVATNDKQRFEFDESGTRIRARQGHSIQVDHGLEPVEPPEILLHGTATRVLDQIRDSGLKRMNRHHVHLHDDDEVAVDVGGRHGKPVILKVLANQMYQKGYEFFVTDNKVWLTDHVPPEFIEFPN